MPFLSVSPTNFRNLASGYIDLKAKEVFFVGENAQGKSNLLETLYFLSYGNSFRTHNDGEALKYGETAFSLRGSYKTGEAVENISVYFEIKGSRGFKRIEKNRKRIMDRKELVNTIPCILYCHEDMGFVTGDPERRRFFVDQTLSLHNVVFIELSRNYKQVLKSRNILLREQRDPALLDTYDQQLVHYGLEIQNRRKVLLAAFNGIFTPLYREVADVDGVRLVYEPSWKETEEQPVSVAEAFFQVQEKRGVDMQLGTTMSGPHRDRISFSRCGQPFVPGASTGQKRLAAVLLRTAQAVFCTRETGKTPVLLMDDVLLELDPEKRRRVQEVLPAYDQLFCTFLSGEPWERYIRSTSRIYRVEKGSWTVEEAHG